MPLTDRLGPYSHNVWDTSSNLSYRTGPRRPNGRLRRQDSLTGPYQNSIAFAPSFHTRGGIPHHRSPPSSPINAPGAWPSVTESRSTIAPASSRVDVVRGDQLSPEIPLRRKKEVHRQRQDLKLSGDYLGVQGINPETGQLDVLTPTTGSKSTISSAASGVQVSVAQESINKYKQGKDELRRQQSLVRWRKDNGQWSSVAEPMLSPIVQSRSTTPRKLISRYGAHITMSDDDFLHSTSSPSSERTPFRRAWPDHGAYMGRRCAVLECWMGGNVFFSNCQHASSCAPKGHYSLRAISQLHSSTTKSRKWQSQQPAF